MKKFLVIVVILICASISVDILIESLGETLPSSASSIEEKTLFVVLGEGVVTNLTINMTGETGNISLEGEWIDGPAKVECAIEPLQALPPFTAKLTFAPFDKIGYYLYRVKAEGKNTTAYYDISIIVTDIGISISTDEENYTKGEEMSISGRITSVYGSAVKSANLTISCGEWKRFTTLHVNNGSFVYNYSISFGDPEGMWKVEVSTVDSVGNTVYKDIFVNVSLPENSVRYKVIFLSPPKGAVYQRGATFNVSVLVMSGDTGVTSLLTTCTLPSMEKINLTEIGDGYYRGEIKIPWDAEEGTWYLSVESINTENGFAGGSSSYISVKSAPLEIEILKPASNSIKYAEKVEFEVKVTYLSGEPVTDAVVRASLSDEEINFTNSGNGTYTAVYSPDRNTNYMLLSITAVDRYNNSGYLSRVFYLSYRSSIPLDIKMIAIILMAMGALGAVFYRTKRTMFAKHLEDVKRELDEIRRLQREAVIKYYREGTISRKTYDMLMQEYAKAYGELMDRYGELLAKMERNKFKWRKLKRKFKTPS
ncbi:MAG: hypothetical protein J7K38_02660 [Thermoplasmata archaeon]|nr:hypothetical protein [Thermoplasmata archaeon]